MLTRQRRAHILVSLAIRKGVLSPKPCEVCGYKRLFRSDGRRAVQAHHDDYSKPLVVRWLCSTHHKRLHATLRAASVEA